MSQDQGRRSGQDDKASHETGCRSEARNQNIGKSYFTIFFYLTLHTRMILNILITNTHRRKRKSTERRNISRI